LAALLHDTLVVGVSQTAAFNRGRHLYSAGRPSRWTLAHISSYLSIATWVTLRLYEHSQTVWHALQMHLTLLNFRAT